MNPRHYQRGWHCTSTLGTIGAAAACARLMGLDAAATAHAMAIAASESSGPEGELRDDGEAASCRARRPQRRARGAAGPGWIHRECPRARWRPGIPRRDGQRAAVARPRAADLGTRWEIVETGITVKLYPSCAGTHPTLDAILDLRRREGFTRRDVDRIDVTVDSITPTVLIHARPRPASRRSSACSSAPPPRLCTASSASSRSMRLLTDPHPEAAASRDDARRFVAGRRGAAADPGSRCRRVAGRSNPSSRGQRCPRLFRASSVGGRARREVPGLRQTHGR